MYVYQGEELGLAEVQDIPDERRQDPLFHRTGGADPGRDGSRVPLPWSGVEPPFGFSPPGASAPPWLPQPKEWRELTVEAQDGDPASMLELHRTALRLRRQIPPTAPLTWQPSPDGVLAFDRGEGLRCIVNISAAPVALPEHTAVLLASTPLAKDAQLPSDSAVWLSMS
jgi:alpha-glucosidase